MKKLVKQSKHVFYICLWLVVWCCTCESILHTNQRSLSSFLAPERQIVSQGHESMIMFHHDVHFNVQIEIIHISNVFIWFQGKLKRIWKRLSPIFHICDTFGIYIYSSLFNLTRNNCKSLSSFNHCYRTFHKTPVSKRFEIHRNIKIITIPISFDWFIDMYLRRSSFYFPVIRDSNEYFLHRLKKKKQMTIKSFKTFEIFFRQLGLALWNYLMIEKGTIQTYTQVKFW